MDINHSPLTQFGIVFADADPTTPEDELVRHVSESLQRATSVSIESRAQELRSAIVVREPGGEWRTLYSRQAPADWIRAEQAV